MLKTIFLCRSAIARTSYRSLVALTRVLAKNDFSTIESYRLPSQTSINEWEFKYDFVPKVSEPKVPPVSLSAIQQEKAEIKKQQMEHELLTRELNTSIKVEANDASVALHERFGFTSAGVMHEVGRKFEEYWDVGWYEKRLD